MSDLISRQKALDGLKYEMKYGAEIDRCGLDTAYDIIENVQSEEPERKKGKWIYDTERVLGDGWTYRQYHCSICNAQQIGAVQNFCPNCGADMTRGE